MARANPFSFLFRPYPTYYIIFVTARCNVRCPHCFYSNKINSAQESSELSLDEYRKISSGMGKLKAVAITGGEPSLRDDVIEICKVFAKFNNLEYLGFHTNGLLVERLKVIAKELLQQLPDTFIKFELSIDGLFNNHDRLRKSPGLFQRNIELIKYLAAFKAGHKNFAIGINTVYSAANEDQISEIYAYCRKLPVDSYDINFIRGDVGDHALKKVDVEEFIRCVKWLDPGQELRGSSLALASLVGVVKLMRWNAIRKIVKRKEMPFSCMAGRKMLVIAEDGQVFPCELLDKPFGNLRDNGYDIRKLLALESAQEIISDIRKRLCFCTWECAITNSIVHDPALYPEILFRRLVERAKRFGHSGKDSGISRK